jgi:hypothetical protein
MNDGMYQISIPTSSEEGAPVIVASVRACELWRAGFKEELSLQIDDGVIIG